MAKIKPASYSSAYVDIDLTARAHGDGNHCAVVALGLLSGRPATEVQELLSSLGRKLGAPTYNPYIEKAAAALGLRLITIELESVIGSYPRPHRDVLRSVTTHHPRRFPSSWDPSKKYLAWTRGHVCAIIKGETVDWSVNKALRIYRLDEVVSK